MSERGQVDAEVAERGLGRVDEHVEGVDARQVGGAGERSELGGREELVEEEVGVVEEERRGVDEVAAELGDVDAARER